MKCCLLWAGEVVKEPLWMHEVSRERSRRKGGMNFEKLWGVVEDDLEIDSHPQVSRRHESPMENTVQDSTSTKQLTSSSGSVNVGRIRLPAGPDSPREIGSAGLAPDSI